MERPEILKREIKVLVFDQYGTIGDMQRGLTEAAAPFLTAKRWPGKPNSFVTWWRRTHFENSMIDALCDRGHTPYREIGHRAVSYVMDRCGISYTEDEVRWLVAEIEKLKPFPDVIEALGRLRRGGGRRDIRAVHEAGGTAREQGVLRCSRRGERNFNHTRGALPGPPRSEIWMTF